MNLDFYMVCAIFLLEFIYEIYNWVVFFKSNKTTDQITPIDPKKGAVAVNSFAPDNSLEDIEINMNSQKRGNESSPFV